jgi:hypothetical protein
MNPSQSRSNCIITVHIKNNLYKITILWPDNQKVAFLQLQFWTKGRKKSIKTYSNWGQYPNISYNKADEIPVNLSINYHACFIYIFQDTICATDCHFIQVHHWQITTGSNTVKCSLKLVNHNDQLQWPMTEIQICIIILDKCHIQILLDTE